MNITFGPNLKYFLWSLVTGLLLALLYDALRVSRKIIKTPDIIVNIEDILFIISTGLIASGLAYWVNNGFFRIYSLGSIILGFALYRIVIGNKIVNFFIHLYHLIHKALVALFKFLIVPLKFIIKIIGKPIFIVIGGTTKRLGAVNRQKCEKKN